MFPQTNNYVLFESFQIWTSVPWMTSWSTPVVHVNKYIPKGSNQLIEEYIGRLLQISSIPNESKFKTLLPVETARFSLAYFVFLVQKRNLIELLTLEHVTLTVCLRCL
jgi:hypothetical protein